MKEFNVTMHARLIVIAGIAASVLTFLFIQFQLKYSFVPEESILPFFYITHSLLCVVAGVLLLYKKRLGVYVLVLFYIGFLVALILPSQSSFSDFNFRQFEGLKSSVFFFSVFSGTVGSFIFSFSARPFALMGPLMNILFLGISAVEVWNIKKFRRILSIKTI